SLLFEPSGVSGGHQPEPSAEWRTAPGEPACDPAYIGTGEACHPSCGDRGGFSHAAGGTTLVALRGGVGRRAATHTHRNRPVRATRCCSARVRVSPPVPPLVRGGSLSCSARVRLRPTRRSAA